MNHLRMTAITLIFTSFYWLPDPAFGGGFGEGRGEVAGQSVGVSYEPSRLPLTVNSARTWIALRETKVKPLPDQTPFGEVLRSLRDTTRGSDGKGTPLTLYVDPSHLRVAGITMATPIASPFIGSDEISLHTYLEFILRPFRFAHRVPDGLVIIELPCDDCPDPVEVSTAEAWTWLLLHEEIPLHFPNETSLEDVVKAIYRATVGRGPGGRGLVIHIDPVGLQNAEKSPTSLVTIELDRVSLCTSMGLVLRQLDLRFFVRGDGVLVITSEDDGSKMLMDESEVIENYRRLHSELFWLSREHDGQGGARGARSQHPEATDKPK